MEPPDACLLDLIYRNEEPQGYARALFTKITAECAIKIDVTNEDIQNVANNWRIWAHILHIVHTAIDNTQPYTAVVCIQYALSREDALRADISEGLTERRRFFDGEWMPFLVASTREFTRTFSGHNASEVMQNYANLMMDAWQHQRIPVRVQPVVPIPTTEHEVTDTPVLP